jgi:ABC-type transporter MlaC component
LRRYALLSNSYDGRASHQVVRLEGETAIDLDWQWSNVDGRFRIVDISPV